MRKVALTSGAERRQRYPEANAICFGLTMIYIASINYLTFNEV